MANKQINSKSNWMLCSIKKIIGWIKLIDFQFVSEFEDITIANRSKRHVFNVKWVWVSSTTSDWHRNKQFVSVKPADTITFEGSNGEYRAQLLIQNNLTHGVVAFKVSFELSTQILTCYSDKNHISKSIPSTPFNSYNFTWSRACRQFERRNALLFSLCTEPNNLLGGNCEPWTMRKG